jgi:hypothetical protein
MQARTLPTIVFATFTLLLVSCTQDQSNEVATVSDVTQSLGFDPAELDDATHPGDDFFAYVNGKWIAENEIPADRSRYGAFDILRQKTKRGATSSEWETCICLFRTLQPAMRVVLRHFSLT